MLLNDRSLGCSVAIDRGIQTHAYVTDSMTIWTDSRGVFPARPEVGLKFVLAVCVGLADEEGARI